jgi:hypothetical protein
MAVKLKRQKAVAEPQQQTGLIGKQDIKRSALEAWRKLDTVIQNELSLIMKGDKEITASTAAAVIKFIEASAELARGPEDLSAKDSVDRQQAIMGKIYDKLPTFDDEGDEYPSN